MAKIEIKDTAGKKVGSADLADGVFGIEPNTFAVHQVVRSQLAARRAGTHSTLTRGKVSGGGKKPWRQKGTGRARQGSTRSPQWAGGGVVFGPHPRSYAFKVPNKVVKLAMRSALSAKLADEVLYVDRRLRLRQALDQAGRRGAEVARHRRVASRSSSPNDDINAMLSLRNLAKVRVITASEANTYDLVDNTAAAVHEAGSDLARGGAVLMNDPRDIVIRPVISEKSYDMIEQNRYTFEVAKTASKPQIAQAVTEIFGVTVTKREHHERQRQAAPRARCQGQDARLEEGRRHPQRGRLDRVLPGSLGKGRTQQANGCRHPARIWSRPAPW